MMAGEKNKCITVGFVGYRLGNNNIYSNLLIYTLEKIYLYIHWRNK